MELRTDWKRNRCFATQDRFIRSDGFELRGYAKNTFQAKIHRSTRLSVYQSKLDDMDTLYLVHFDVLQDGKPKIKLGRTLYSLQQPFNSEPYPWREVKTWRLLHRHVVLIEFEAKKAFAKHMRPGPEGFKGRYECYPIDLTQWLVEHMENAVQAARIDPQGHPKRLEAYCNQSAVQYRFHENQNNKACNWKQPANWFRNSTRPS